MTPEVLRHLAPQHGDLGGDELVARGSAAARLAFGHLASRARDVVLAEIRLRRRRMKRLGRRHRGDECCNDEEAA
jgi:hypothetical protein